MSPPFGVRSASLALLVMLPCACRSPTFEFSDGSSTGSSQGGTFGGAGQGAAAGATGDAGAAGEASSAGAGGADSGPYDTGSEDCTNAADDDADGLLDCMDADCARYFACVPTPPEGWQGPYALWEGEGTAPACSDLVYYPTGQGIVAKRLLGDAEPSRCPTCSCGPAEGAECASASVQYFADEECQDALGEVSASLSCSAQVIAHRDNDRPRSVRFDAPAAGGTCAPRSEGSIVSPPVRTAVARACGEPSLVAAGCSANQLCLARPRAPFAPAVCIAREGEHPCPAGFPDVRPHYFRVASDTRSCLPCRCGAPACRGAVTESPTDDACTEPAALVPSGVCTPVQADDSSGSDTRSLAFEATSGAACQIGPSGPSGTYALSEPMTYCCYGF